MFYQSIEYNRYNKQSNDSNFRGFRSSSPFFYLNIEQVFYWQNSFQFKYNPSYFRSFQSFDYQDLQSSIRSQQEVQALSTPIVSKMIIEPTTINFKPSPSINNN